MADGEDAEELRKEVERLRGELAEERQKQLPAPTERNAELEEKLWDSFFFSQVGQGLQLSSLKTEGPLKAIWRTYFENSMPGGIRSTSLLRMGSRSDIELHSAYPSQKCDWQHRLLEVSVVMQPEFYKDLKTETLDGKGRNIGISAYLEFATSVGFPQYPYRVQEQTVRNHSGLYGENMEKESFQKHAPPGEELSKAANLQMMKEKREVKKPLVVASLKAAYMAVTQVGDAETPYTLLPEDRAADYEEVIQPYREHHLGRGLDASVGGQDYPLASKVRSSGILLPLYGEQKPLVKFTPNRLWRSAKDVGWWFAQARGEGGAVPPTSVPELLPFLMQDQANNPFLKTDVSGIFMKCDGWLRTNVKAEVIIYMDEKSKNLLFILLNGGTDRPAMAGFAKYTPKKGEIYRHEVLLATDGLGFLVDYARGQTASATKAMLSAIDLSKVKRD